MAEKKWIGRKFKCVYGLDEGSVYEVVSEPYPINRKGEEAVDVKCITDKFQDGYIECNDLEYTMYYKEIKKKKQSRKGGKRQND